MDEGILARFVKSWNSLVQQRIGYERQRDLELVAISPESQAELPLLEKGSLGGALFTTLVPGLKGFRKDDLQCLETAFASCCPLFTMCHTDVAFKLPASLKEELLLIVCRPGGPT